MLYGEFTVLYAGLNFEPCFFDTSPVVSSSALLRAGTPQTTEGGALLSESNYRIYFLY